MLVCVVEMDYMRNRGVVYYKVLMRSGWGGIVEFLEIEEEGYFFYFFDLILVKVGVFLYKLVFFVSDDVE